MKDQCVPKGESGALLKDVQRGVSQATYAI